VAFNSLQFIVFFPVVLAAYYLVRPGWRWLLLFVASCYFYMAWRPEYILLILGESALAYLAALTMVRTTDPVRKKRTLTAAIVALVGTLFVFKYYGFFNDTLAAVLGWVGIVWRLPDLDLVLPLGISFHTFILIGYLIDVYRAKVPAETHPGIFGVFSIFFPLLVAGPIERAESLLPQFRREVGFDARRVIDGLRLMTWGFFKKVVIADRLALFVDQVYGAPRGYDGPTLAAATVFFALQIYCDFSAYTDIARGAARTLGITLSENFRQPYFAISIADFWKRWHISLSTWLTDYVYSAFTRAKWLKLRWYPKFLASLMLTFLVSGIWHGAAWTYVIWGALHGSFLVSSMLTQNIRRRFVAAVGLARVPRLHTALRIVMIFTLVCFTYVFFRAGSVGDAWYVITHLASGATAPGAELPSVRYFLYCGALMSLVLAVDAVALWGVAERWAVSRPRWLEWSLDYAMVTAIVLLGASESVAQFIYFQF
jgi:D-alanyl-lipoteichoic acid acyltransferase DltB (MBOAT superfamily)